MSSNAERTDALLATAYRSGYVNSVHYGSVVVVDPDGEVCFSRGAPELPTFGRSANKMMQAVAMLRLGLDVTSEQLALATASHSGGPRHVEVVLSILDSAGLTPSHLHNVESAPLGRQEYDEFQRNHGSPSRLLMNCSGKHASMLATCVVHSWDLDSYLEQRHPLQSAITDTIAEFTNQATEGIGIDGCGAPAHRITLTGLAQSLRLMMHADEATPEGRVREAIRSHPELVGGPGRDVTEFLRAAPGWIGKDGADGVMVLASPEGFAVAVKIGDGAERPRIPVAIAALERAGVVVSGLSPEIASPPVLGGRKQVGELLALED